jgi:hypothetical protein
MGFYTTSLECLQHSDSVDTTGCTRYSYDQSHKVSSLAPKSLDLPTYYHGLRNPPILKVAKKFYCKFVDLAKSRAKKINLTGHQVERNAKY